MSKSIAKTGSSSAAKTTAANISAMIKSLKKTKMFDQLCLLVLDGSGSMNHLLEDGSTKLDATRSAIIELVRSLKKSTKSSGFHLAIICYHAHPQLQLYAQLIDSVKEEKINLGDDFGLGEYTRIDLALAEAEKVSDAFLSSVEPGSPQKRDVRVLLMSDGYCNLPENTIGVVNSLKSKYGDKVRICCCLLANEDEADLKVAERLMKEIASNDKSGKLCFTRASSGKGLRSFFEGSSTDE